MKRRDLLLLAGVGVIAAILAFPLRGIVNQLVLLPIAYMLWFFRLIYLSLDQILWWFAIVLITLLFLGQSLLPDLGPGKNLILHRRNPRGSVESFAEAIKKSEKGIYFKWLLANRLGKLAHQLLLQREHGKPRSVFAPLRAEGWDPPPEIQNYLEKGLHGSFTDYPNTGWKILTQPEKTPFDVDADRVVEFLGSKINSNRE